MTHSNGRPLGVTGMGRVEGEASVRIAVRDGTVAGVELNIFEPPRYFEALLVGRHLGEAPDITARVCGICPVAYQMTACSAADDLAGTAPPPEISALRRLLYCGEWLQSHALHVYLLHAPDFLGLADAVQLADADPSALKRGLALKKTGNRIMETVGGRAIHPVNVRLGGFYRAPSPADLRSLVDPLERGLEAAMETVEWVSSFDFPDVSSDYRFVALRSPGRYPIEAGRPASSDGLDLSPSGFDALVEEEHLERSTALHARLRGIGPYLTGPLARFALNSEWLTPMAAEAAAEAGLDGVCRNPYMSIIVRAVEMVFACEEALALIRGYTRPEPPFVEWRPAEGRGTGVTEAPRGLLLQAYEIDGNGTIRSARIMPPTSQNQVTIEDDLRRVAGMSLGTDPDELRSICERAVRNHDPCISCAAHFLDLELVSE